MILTFFVVKARAGADDDMQRVRGALANLLQKNGVRALVDLRGKQKFAATSESLATNIVTAA